MKKNIIISVILLIAIMTVGCSNQNEKSDSTIESTISKKSIEINNNIFKNSDSNKKISVKEAKNNIKVYLNTQKQLLGQPAVIYKMSSGNLNSKDKKDIEKIIELTNKNDENFLNYINNNILPKDYDQWSKRIYTYINNSNIAIINLNDKLNNLEKESKEGKISLDNFKDILPESNVNGREQKKIEEFLERENINTDAFKK